MTNGNDGKQTCKSPLLNCTSRTLGVYGVVQGVGAGSGTKRADVGVVGSEQESEWTTQVLGWHTFDWPIILVVLLYPGPAAIQHH